MPLPALLQSLSLLKNRGEQGAGSDDSPFLGLAIDEVETVWPIAGGLQYGPRWL